jgi:hypothetical protein
VHPPCATPIYRRLGPRDVSPLFVRLASKVGIEPTELDFGHPRIVPLEKFFEAASEYDFEVPFGTDVFDIYRDLYEREFKFVPRHERRVGILANDTADAAFIEAAFGAFPESGRLASLSDAYVDTFDPIKIEPTSENWIKIFEGDFNVPLHFTKEKLKRDHDGWSEPTLFVVDPASAADLIDLWNIRQFHTNILPVNLSGFVESKDFLKQFIRDHYRPLPRNLHGLMTRPTIQFGRSISEQRARILIEEAELMGLSDVEWFPKFDYDRIWKSSRDDSMVRPRRARVTAASTDLELALSDEGSGWHCRFTSLSPDFVDAHGLGAARWINTLTFQSYGSHNALALALPVSFTGDQSRGLRIGGTTVISREGFVLPQQYKQHREYFRLLTGQEAVIRWLGSQNIVAEPSDPGRIADQILTSLGGLWRTRLIADRETLKLLDDMSKSVRKRVDGEARKLLDQLSESIKNHTDDVTSDLLEKLSTSLNNHADHGKLEEFPDRSTDVIRWKGLVQRRAKESSGGGIGLDDFVRANILRLGMVLECTNCRKKNWLGIQDLREQLTCDRCLKQYPFPQGDLNFVHTPWQYRVVGPFSVPNYAEGAYATVFALSAFAKGLRGDRAKITYATGLNIKDLSSNPFEVDFTLWYQRGRLLDLPDEPVLIFGEAKSFAATSFKVEDVDRMRTLAAKFPGAFLAFTTLKDGLSGAEKEEIGKLATWGREALADGRPRAPVIVLTGIELFAPWNIGQSWKQHGGQQAKFGEMRHLRLNNLWTLADVTQQLYLELPTRNARFVSTQGPTS